MLGAIKQSYSGLPVVTLIRLSGASSKTPTARLVSQRSTPSSSITMSLDFLWVIAIPIGLILCTLAGYLSIRYRCRLGIYRMPGDLPYGEPEARKWPSSSICGFQESPPPYQSIPPPYWPFAHHQETTQQHCLYGNEHRVVGAVAANNAATHVSEQHAPDALGARPHCAMIVTCSTID